MLEDHIAWLDAAIALDEEANDPNGFLPGLYRAREMAVDTASRAAEPPDGLTVAVWSDSGPSAALSGSYAGREGITEGFAAAAMTVMDLWNAGESGITVELYRERGGEKQ